MSPIHITLLASAIVAAVLVVRYDLYEREPWWMLVLAAPASTATLWGWPFRPPAAGRSEGE